MYHFKLALARTAFARGARRRDQKTSKNGQEQQKAAALKDIDKRYENFHLFFNFQ